tara:strand:+ start:518 stop:634 length:117 start_codon:yes stop_codon:yes gene_type:complete
MIIDEWRTPEFKDRHSKNIPKPKPKRNQIKKLTKQDIK